VCSSQCWGAIILDCSFRHWPFPNQNERRACTLFSPCRSFSQRFYLSDARTSRSPIPKFPPEASTSWCSWRLRADFSTVCHSQSWFFNPAEEDAGSDSEHCTPSVSKYKIFYICETNISRHVLVYIFEWTYTLKDIYIHLLHKTKTSYILKRRE
jgi:hypothetical protein